MNALESDSACDDDAGDRTDIVNRKLCSTTIADQPCLLRVINGGLPRGATDLLGRGQISQVIRVEIDPAHELQTALLQRSDHLLGRRQKTGGRIGSPWEGEIRLLACTTSKLPT
jgi:hypothetical protein